jgi:hypothetical protein
VINQHPFLLHAALAFTQAHDRLIGEPSRKPGAAELFHNYRAAALFNHRLNADATPSERDAIVSHQLILPAVVIFFFPLAAGHDVAQCS